MFALRVLLSGGAVNRFARSRCRQVSRRPPVTSPGPAVAGALACDLLDFIEPVLGAPETRRLRAEFAEFLSNAEPADGRAARSHRTRLAVVDAMRSLHADGDLRPTAPRVAERAGVSLRTVWQHFDDLEALLVEAGRRDLEIVLSILRPIAAGQPLADRISQFVGQRCRVLEQMTPSWRAARVQAPFSRPLQHSKQQMIAVARAELETVFAPELARLHDDRRADLASALHAISLWSYWESLRTEVGLSPAQAQSAVSAAFTALLA
jgi:TetR/AcrR family transcriptional regulator of autoinduction and epiphytic fitness